MPKSTPLCVALLILASATGANAQDTEREAVLALMDKAFAAVASRDPDDMRAIQLAEGNSLSFRPRPDGQPGELEMRFQSNEEMLAGGADNGHTYSENWSGEPTVLIRGPIAVVWGEYEFWLDGRFSHCGVDSVALAKADGQWKVANWMWTVEKEGCQQ